MNIERHLLGALLLVCSASAGAHGNAGAFSGGADHHDDESVSEPVKTDNAPAQPAKATEADDPATVHSESRLIVLAQAVSRAVIERRSGVGRVTAGAGAVHDVNAFISGQVHELLVRPGIHVERGDPVATVQSPEFIRTQKAYLALLDNEQKQEILRDEGRLPNYMRDARENLHWWGMNDQEIKRLEQRGEAVQAITVRSPVAGVVTEVLAQPGDLVNAGDRAMAQFVVMGRVVARVIADEQPLWLEGFLFPSQLAGVRPASARVAIRLPDGSTLQRPLHSVSPAVDERQLGRIMVELGSEADLYPGQPVNFELLIEHGESVWIPRGALMGQGLESVVFVQREPGTYARRTVEPGAAVGDWVQIAGLAPGTEVVVQGKMALEGAYRLSAIRSVAQHDDHHH